MPANLPWLLIIAAIWSPVVFVLGAQWTIHPQYHYGWFVPALCLYLAWERSHSSPAPTIPHRRWGGAFVMVLAGIVFVFARVLQESNPIWRAPAWGMAAAAAIITLASVYLLRGFPNALHFAFPVLFFLLAVPWPNFVELSAVRHLSRWNTSGVVEILSFLGIPSLQHGNVIEINTGVVGIEEACSGIRSLQGTLMLSIFFGEFYPVSTVRRLLLVVFGIASALFFNLARTCFLTFMAAHNGTDEVQKWHDSAGMSVLVACAVSIWIAAILLSRFNRGKQRVPDSPPPDSAAAKCSSLFWKPWPVAATLLLFAVSVEAANGLWFAVHGSIARDFDWSLKWPENKPGYRTREISAAAYNQLRYDIGQSAAWTDGKGRDWQVFYLQWLPARTFYGRARTALAVGHNPEICLTGNGWIMEGQLSPTTVEASPGVPLTFQRYLFRADEGVWHVFFAVIEDRPDVQLTAVTGPATGMNKIKDALAGSRVFGQRIIEAAVRSTDSPEDALQIFQQQLSQWVRNSSPPANSSTAVAGVIQ